MLVSAAKLSIGRTSDIREQNFNELQRSWIAIDFSELRKQKIAFLSVQGTFVLTSDFLRGSF